MPRFNLVVNGQSLPVEADAEMPLLWVLRDLLGLTGTKYGCGRGLCGACTVHVGGQPVRSCLTPAAALDGESITTIEGLDETHPVIEAWIALSVPQCGYCQPGQIMSATALLARNPDPSEDDIIAAMNGNLCRCGSYLRIRKAIQRAAEMGRGEATDAPTA